MFIHYSDNTWYLDGWICQVLWWALGNVHFPISFKKKSWLSLFSQEPLWLGVPGTRVGTLGVWLHSVAHLQRPLSLSRNHSCEECSGIAQCQRSLNPHLRQPCSSRNCRSGSVRWHQAGAWCVGTHSSWHLSWWPPMRWHLSYFPNPFLQVIQSQAKEVTGYLLWKFWLSSSFVRVKWLELLEEPSDSRGAFLFILFKEEFMRPFHFRLRMRRWKGEEGGRVGKRTNIYLALALYQEVYICWLLGNLDLTKVCEVRGHGCLYLSVSIVPYLTLRNEMNICICYEPMSVCLPV